jgi:tetratricopeptide (TPR) repeat protein
VSAALLAACGSKPQAGTPHEIVQSAWNCYRLGEFDRATRLFEQVLAQTPGSDPEHLAALYGAASSYQWRGSDENPAQAVKLYRQLIALAPQSDLAAWSSLALARMSHLVPVGPEPDYPTVRQLYQVVIDQHPYSPAAEEAFLYQQSTLVSTLKPDEAQTASATLSAYLDRHPSSRYQSVIWDLLANCHETLHEPQPRLQAAIKAIQTAQADPRNPSIDWANTYWNIATSAEFDVGDFATAREYYGRLLREYPTDIKIYGVRQSLARRDEVEARLRRGQNVDPDFSMTYVPATLPAVALPPPARATVPADPVTPPPVEGPTR